MKEISQGAEASVFRTDSGIQKVRTQKTYRHPDLDLRLRQFRTRREATVLEKLPVAGPTLFGVDDGQMTIDMEFIDGVMLRDVLNQDNAELFMSQLGQMLRCMHDAGIVHGDLTTSNMLVSNSTLFLIDFGLSEFSDHVEEKAVDLHLLQNSLEAKHPDLVLFTLMLQAYNPSKKLLERFEKVSSRGRYKQKH